jgi:DNA-directed RNA polymerase
VWEAIDGMVSKPVEIMKWLQHASTEFTKVDKPVTWRTPSGFLVHQANYTSKRTKIQLRIGGKMYCRNADIPTNKLSRAKQRNGIAPNFVHGLDAAVLTSTVLKCKRAGIRDLGVVHDSFAAHAENCPRLAGALRLAAYEIFSEDILGDFKAACEEQTGAILPDPPSKGTLDIESVLRSLYFYS